MKSNLNVILCLAAVVLFFIGRFTAPRPQGDTKRFTDSIRNHSLRVTRERDLALDSMRHYHTLADTWFDLAQKENKQAKAITRTIYAQDTSRNHAMSVVRRDSTIRAIFLKN